MTRNALLLVIVLLAFGALSLVALRDHGYFGLFSAHFTSSAGLQVLADLVIVCVLAILWMLRDARSNGRTVWPFVALTLAAGAFGPLLYLLVGELNGHSARRGRAIAA